MKPAPGGFGLRFAIPRQGREDGDATALFLRSDFFAEQRANDVGSRTNGVGLGANMEAARVPKAASARARMAWIVSIASRCSGLPAGAFSRRAMASDRATPVVRRSGPDGHGEGEAGAALFVALDGHCGVSGMRGVSLDVGATAATKSPRQGPPEGPPLFRRKRG